MAYLRAVKPPVVRLLKGSEPAQFFRDAEGLKGALEPLMGIGGRK